MNVSVCAAFAVTLTACAALAHDGHSAADQPDRRAVPQPQPRDHRPMEVVDLPDPTVSITVEGEFRVIRSNSLPDHAIGKFPNAQNPNALRSLNRESRIPLNPKPSGRRTPANPEFGVALNGVIFDAGTGEFWTPTGERGFSEWNYDAGTALNQDRFGVDFNHGHVQPTGKYHYHGVPTGLLEALGDDHVHDGHAHEMIQLGWAFDGYPIYAPFGHKNPGDANSDIIELTSSYRLKQGNRPAPPEGPGGPYDGTFAADFEFVAGHGDLDESNGRTGVTPEFPDGTYYYVITDAFPSVPRTWVGTPDRSIAGRRPPPGAGGPGGPGGPGPRDARRPRGNQDAPPPQKAAPDSSSTVAPKSLPVNPALFINEALAAPIVTEERTLADGTKALCYVIRTHSEPQEHAMGPWAPRHIEDGPDKGGIWIHEGNVYDVDGPFVRNAAEFFGDPNWKLYRDDGSVKVTDTKEAFEAAARPDVDPKYTNHVVEGRPEWIDRKVFVFVIPVQPIYQQTPTPIGRPQGGPDRGPRPGGPPPHRHGRDDQAHSHDQGSREHGHGGPPGVVLGIAFNGVNFDPPAPVDAILAAYTLAPFDDAGGHINPHAGYHYHAATGHTKEIPQPDGHAPMIGYAMDGYGLYAHKNADGSVPTDLDECGGHTDEIRGYHYHAGPAGENQIIKGFRGIPGTMTVEE